MKQRGLYWIHEATNYLRADRIITVSATTADELTRFRVAKRSKLAIIPLAAGPEFTSQESPADRDVLSQIGIQRPYFLFVGGYEANKNVETVVSAFNQLANPRIRLVIAAHFQWRHEELRAQWRNSLASYRQISFVAADAGALPALYRHALASVVSSRWESFGFPLVEAMASGTPVISSSAHALPETGGNAALYFSPDSTEELAELMERVVGDSALRRQLHESGIRRAAQFSWQRVGESTARVYQEAVRSVPSGLLTADGR